MEHENLKIISLKEALKLNLSIPNYQRPYRWSTESASLLFNDIYSAFKQIIYNYDFGDNWEIMLTISEDVDLDDEIVVDKTLKPRLINSFV